MRLFLHCLISACLVLAAPLSVLKRADAVTTILDAITAAYASVFSVEVSSLGTLLNVEETTLAVLTGTDITENGLSGSCKAMTVIFARGTTEPGNIGFFTAPAWLDAIEDIIGSDQIAFQGVTPYSATIAEFLAGGSTTGTESMAAMVNQTLVQCPDSKIIMSGYSQGGQLVHKAAALLPTSIMAQVSGVVIFGDPLYGTDITGIDSSKALIVCHEGDNICEGGDLILFEHLNYSEDAVTAAEFAVAAAGLS